MAGHVEQHLEQLDDEGPLRVVAPRGQGAGARLRPPGDVVEHVRAQERGRGKAARGPRIGEGGVWTVEGVVAAVEEGPLPHAGAVCELT